jgi:hypothetical protein
MVLAGQELIIISLRRGTYFGIHYRFVVEAGQAVGRSAAEWAIHYDRTNGLLAALLPGYRGNDDR